MLLTTSSYTPNQDTHRYLSDVTNEVANGNGYTTGGKTLAGMSVAYDAPTNVLKIDTTDVSTIWAGSTFTARYGVLYDSSPGSDATRPLIGYIDFGADASPINGNLTVTWHANGIATVTVS